MKLSLVTYTFSHFCVDFACFFMLFHSFKPSGSTLETVALGFLIYNVIAFGLQPFIGFFCDKRKDVPIAVVGCGVLIPGLILSSVHWSSLIICALGNACFHVGGGIDSLRHAKGKMSRSGVFVSAGALGVSLGTLVGQNKSIPLLIPVLLVAFCGILIIYFTRSKDINSVHIPIDHATVHLSYFMVLFLGLIAVVIRSYVGSVIPIDWKTTTVLMLIPSIGACIGKASGGYLADWLGARTVGTVSLLASIPFLCFGYYDPIYCTIGIILFNITMPIMLCAVASKLPQNLGLAFGLTTLALLCGNVPTFFYALSRSVTPLIMSVFIIASAYCIFISTINKKGEIKHEEIYKTF